MQRKYPYWQWYVNHVLLQERTYKYCHPQSTCPEFHPVYVTLIRIHYLSNFSWWLFQESILTWMAVVANFNNVFCVIYHCTHWCNVCLLVVSMWDVTRLKCRPLTVDVAFILWMTNLCDNKTTKIWCPCCSTVCTELTPHSQAKLKIM